MNLRRSITEKLQKALRRSPVVLLNGPRQCGKTTLIKELVANQGYTYVTFDDYLTLLNARANPGTFIQGLKKPVILDEIQRVPELFLSIKKDVDKNRIPGRYALTRSANPHLIPSLGDSLAGRMAIIDLYPFSQGELEGLREGFIDWAFSNELPATPRIHLSKRDLLERIVKEGFPAVQTLDSDDTISWFDDYLRAMLERDIKDLSNITGINELSKLLQLFASRVGGLLNAADLSRSVGLSAMSVQRYLALLNTIFIVYFAQPWFTNVEKRIVKSPKTFLVDTGLITSLLHLDADALATNDLLMGGILENFVFNELKKQATWSATRTALYHFRTVAGVEIDIILEGPGGSIVAIEVKSSGMITSADSKRIKYLQETYGDKFVRGIILYTGSSVVPFDRNIHAVSISTLWQYGASDTNKEIFYEEN